VSRQRGVCPRTAPAVLIGLVGVIGACNSPSAVVMAPLEVVVASGDSQYGTAGQALGLPLQVVVRTLAGKIPQPDATIAWEVTQGDASFVGTATSVTDSTGSAEIGVRFGSNTGEVVVAATVQTANRPSTTFELFLVDQPVLIAIEPGTASPGGTITLTGENFSPTPEENVVLFSGIRGRVTSASTTELTVEVPLCLPARVVSVSVQLGVVTSASLSVTVGSGGDLENLQVGDVLDVDDDGGLTCLGLPGSGAEYLALVYSASTVGAATHPYQLSGVSSSGPLAATVFDTGDPFQRLMDTGRRLADPQAALDELLRELERELIEEVRETSVGSPPTAPDLSAPMAAPPTVGERRTFQVFQGTGVFTEVTAVARYVGTHAALFVDEQAPDGGFTLGDLQAFAERFDEIIYPGVTGVFGETSDLDGNERVVVLFTPAVNALTPRGSTGFIGGFFYGIDLLPEREGSNAGEIWYALVPDPTGEFSDARSKQTVLEVTPAILAHEFQHMVHFNERVIRLEAESTEALWLSEGLAQFAEEIVALEYEALDDLASADLFRRGTRDRSRRYLTGPDTVSVIITTGQGSLAERGAGFLFVAYLEDQLGGDLLGRLTRTTRTGVENVESETGQAWADLLGAWWSAVYLDGPGPESGPEVYPDVDLRGFLGNPYPLDPVGLGAGDFTVSGSLWSSSVGYYIVVPPAGGSTALRLGGEAGGISSRQAELRVRIIRIS
jgi:hypothetical protein